jgi:hypothetical protein
VACLVEKRNICVQDFDGEFDGKRQLGRTKLINIKMDIKEIERKDVDLIGLAEQRNKMVDSCELGGAPRFPPQKFSTSSGSTGL